MSLSKALGAYFSLSKKQRKLLQNKRYTDTLKCSQWLRLIAHLITFDQHADQARQRTLTSGLLSLLLSSASAMLFATHETLVNLLLFWFILLLTIIIWSFYFRLHQQGLAAHVKQFILPMLQILQQDMRSNDKLHMTLQCGNSCQNSHATHQNQPNANDYYPWLSITAPLQDGSRLQWSISDVIHNLMPANDELHRTISFRIDFPTTIYQPHINKFSNEANPLLISEQWLTMQSTQKSTYSSQEKAMSLFDFLDMIGQAYCAITVNMNSIHHENVRR